MINGYKDLSLIDYPGLIAPVVFVGGCNFRCPFCHNADLVLHPGLAEEFSIDTILKRIEKAKSLCDGVVITGGEPALWPELEDFIRQIRRLGLKVKLDTNGSLPDVLERLNHQGLIDYVAMDIKTALHRYREATGVKADVSAIQKSITLLQNSNVSHEFRTTCVPSLVSADEILSICRLVGTNEKLILQQYRPVNTIDPAYTLIQPYSEAEMEKLLSIAIEQGVDGKIT